MGANKIVFPSAYFAPISYYHSIVQSEAILLDYNEHFLTRTYRNRCEIYAANGSLNHSIPVKKATGKTKVKDVRISYDMDWQRIHWKSIESAYMTSPFFEFYQHRFQEIYFTFLSLSHT